MAQKMWNQVDEGLEGGYDAERIGGDLEDLDVGPEAMEAMEAAGFLNDDGIEYFDQAVDVELEGNTLAAVAQDRNGGYTLLIDEDFYEIYSENGLIDAAEVMRHEYNHVRDREGDLLPDLREDGVLDPLSAYIIAVNLEGSRDSMEGANQYVTRLENPYSAAAKLVAYPEETQEVAEQIRQYLPEMSEDIAEQLGQQGLDSFNYGSSEVKVDNVEIEDGKYFETGIIDGEEYHIELEMPKISDLEQVQEELSGYN